MSPLFTNRIRPVSSFNSQFSIQRSIFEQQSVPKTFVSFHPLPFSQFPSKLIAFNPPIHRSSLTSYLQIFLFSLVPFSDFPSCKSLLPSFLSSLTFSLHFSFYSLNSSTSHSTTTKNIRTTFNNSYSSKIKHSTETNIEPGTSQHPYDY